MQALLLGHSGYRMCMHLRNVMRDETGPRLTRICAHSYITKNRKPLFSLRIAYVRRLAQILVVPCHSYSCPRYHVAVFIHG